MEFGNIYCEAGTKF